MEFVEIKRSWIPLDDDDDDSITAILVGKKPAMGPRTISDGVADVAEPHIFAGSMPVVVFTRAYPGRFKG